MPLKNLTLFIYAPYFTNGKSEFACLDAYTGRLIWKLPVEAFPPRESVAVAYGNLYLIPDYVKEEQMDDYVTIDQVWAIGTKPWPMWRHDPEHSATGQSGPANLTLRWNFITGGAVGPSPSVVDGITTWGRKTNTFTVLTRGAVASSGSLILAAESNC
jgi:outer membrane protein assembly factor BamB